MLRKYSDQQLIDILNGYFEGKKLSDQEKEELIRDAITSESDDETSFWLMYYYNKREVTPASERTQKLVERIKNHPELKEFFNKKIKLFQPQEKPVDFLFGQIFETSLPANWEFPYQDRRLVVLLSSDKDCYNPGQPDVQVAPISFETEYKMPKDVLVKSPEILNGIPFLVRVSDVQNIFTWQLSNYYGKLDARTARKILDAWKSSSDTSQKLQSKQIRFWKNEHQITRYMREPVQAMIRISEQFPESEVFDLQYWLPENVYQHWLERQESVALAAATPAIFELLKPEVEFPELTLIERDDLLCKLTYTEDWIGLKFLTDKVDSFYLKIQHGFEVLFQEEIKVEDISTLVHIPNFPELLNKELNFEIQLNEKLITEKIYLHYEPKQ